jgi:hypothetical protein
VASAQSDLFVGLRGKLAIADGLQAQWEADGFDEDVFDLVVARSEILGFAEFGGERRAVGHWGHCDAGGTWTNDGEEHLLAWLQVHVRGDEGAAGSAGHEAKRLLPIASTLTVLRDALEHIGTVTLTEADAIVPLGLMADPISRIAVGQGWLLSALRTGPRDELVITIEAGGSVAKLADDCLADGMRLLGEELLGPISERPAEEPDRPGEFLYRRFTRGAIQLRATTPVWSVDLVAWAIELTARACHALGVRESVLISVRRGEPVA